MDLQWTTCQPKVILGGNLQIIFSLAHLEILCFLLLHDMSVILSHQRLTG